MDADSSGLDLLMRNQVPICSSLQSVQGSVWVLSDGDGKGQPPPVIVQSPSEGKPECHRAVL